MASDPTGLQREPLVLAGFEKTVPPGTLDVLLAESGGAQAAFDRWCETLLSSVGTRHFPVYRMADGEFEFAVGPRPALLPGGVPHPWEAAKIWYRGLTGRKAPTAWGESYGVEERRALLERYRRNVAEIAQRGALGLHLVRSPGRFGEQYYAPLLEWLAEAGVRPEAGNYVNFYFIYALLSGPARLRLLGGRRVVVYTSFVGDKAARLVAGLKADGAASVTLIGISPTQALLEKLAPPGPGFCADLALVGAGIGSANILSQLAYIQGPCLDAGICLDCWASPELRGTRHFLRTNPDP